MAQDLCTILYEHAKIGLTYINMHFMTAALTPLISAGELKNPSVAIPKGTIIAVSYTFIVYVLLFLMISATCDRSEMAYQI